MTTSLLWVTLGGALIFCSVKCVKFLPLVAGRRVSGDHCTGSLVVLFAAGVTALLQKLLGAAGLAAALRAIGRGTRGGSGGSGEEPAAPAEPAPAEPVIPELPVVP